MTNQTPPTPNWQPGYGQPHQPAPYGYPAPIIINNNTSAFASASAIGVGYRRPYRRQSFWAHFWLFMFTAGVGNVIYAWMVSSANRRNGW
ncbi:hypothetical protein ACFVSN_12940 [Kitasatospora sp. NPDC057904]|uniref:hypothetical protein n=1 Tax=Kitasatospora sp. NPDC057904 TaxID=3346275 RepID=UPI0036D8D084